MRSNSLTRADSEFKWENSTPTNPMSRAAVFIAVEIEKHRKLMKLFSMDCLIAVIKRVHQRTMKRTTARKPLFDLSPFRPVFRPKAASILAANRNAHRRRGSLEFRRKDAFPRVRDATAVKLHRRYFCPHRRARTSQNFRAVVWRSFATRSLLRHPPTFQKLLSRATHLRHPSFFLSSYIHDTAEWGSSHGNTTNRSIAWFRGIGFRLIID